MTMNLISQPIIAGQALCEIVNKPDGKEPILEVRHDSA